MRGSALLGVMVAASSFGFGMLSLSKLQGNLTLANNEVKQYDEALKFGKSKLEQMRGFEAVNSKTGLAAYQDINSGTDSVNGHSSTFSRTWSVTDSSNGKSKAVVVTVSWSGQKGTTESISLNSTINQTSAASSGQLFLTSAAGSIVPNSNQISPNVPEGATDNGDGTSNYTPSGSSTVLTYDNTSGEVTKIDGNDAHSISGLISLGTGSLGPSGGVQLADIDVSANNTNGTSYCSDTNSGAYSCIVSNAWGGTINLTGVTGVEVCINATQPYSNITSNLISNDDMVIKGGESCLSGYSLHQSL